MNKPQLAEMPSPNVLTKLVFGIGSSAETVHAIGFSVFCFYFYSQVIGLSPSLVGLAIGIALVFDAVSDPLIGMYSDRLRTKLGRRHPLMIISALPTGMFFWLLFSPPEVLYGDTTALFFYLLGCIIGLRVSLTFFIIPHISFGAEIVNDYIGRSKVMAYHTLFLWVGGAAVLYFGLGVFFAPDTCDLDNCLDSATNYSSFGVFWGAVLTVLILITSIGTLHRVKHLKIEEDNQQPALTWAQLKAKLVESLQEFMLVFKNRNFRALLFGMLCLAMTSGIHEAMSTFMVKYYWELTTDQYKMYAVCTALGFVFTFIFTPVLHKKLGKRKMLYSAAFLQSIITILPVILRITDIMPANNTPYLFPLMLFFTSMYYFAYSIVILTVVSALGDISDQHYLEHQERREGLFYSARNFFGKLASGGGTLIGGLGLTLIAFPVGETDIANIAQSDVDQLGYIYATTSIFALFSAYFYAKYSISEAEHNDILRKIKQLTVEGAK